jgi:hypothetical protein
MIRPPHRGFTPAVRLTCLLYACLALSCHPAGGPPRKGETFLDLPDAAPLSATDFQRSLPLERSQFSIQVQDHPEWGPEETWTLADKEELSRWNLDHLIIRFEQGRFQGLYFGRATNSKTAPFTLEDNLALVGIAKEDITPTSVGWEAFDKGGQPIDIRNDGTWYQSFEHRPGH